MILPDKIFYKIGEVARIADVKTSVLRFWETEFDFINPEKSGTGQRLYTKREVELILHVRHLLYDDKFTIEGVKKKITPKGKLVADVSQAEPVTENSGYLLLLKEIKEDLLSLQDKIRLIDFNSGA